MKPKKTKLLKIKSSSKHKSRKFLTNERDIDLFCLYYSMNGGNGRGAFKRVTGEEPKSPTQITKILARSDVKARLNYLMTDNLDVKELAVIAKQVISEMKGLALSQIPEDHFTYNHKLKALELLAKFAKVIDGDTVDNQTNNTFIVVRSDDASISAVEVVNDN